MLVMCGTWDCTSDGVWNFTIDKQKMGRCVNIRAGLVLHNDLAELVKLEFGMDDTVVPELAYWIHCTMSVFGVFKNPPVAFGTNEGFSIYLMFVGFKPVRGGDSNERQPESERATKRLMKSLRTLTVGVHEMSYMRMMRKSTTTTIGQI